MNVDVCTSLPIRLRFRRHGEMRTSPEVYGTRSEADDALWKLADEGRPTGLMTGVTSCSSF